jgi:hypothetical protein
MIRRALIAIALAGCVDQSPYDPARYAEREQDASVDPDTVALPRGPRRWMLDPRSPLSDAGRD